jgi:hypothetical protein
MKRQIRVALCTPGEEEAIRRDVLAPAVEDGRFWLFPTLDAALDATGRYPDEIPRCRAAALEHFPGAATGVVWVAWVPPYPELHLEAWARRFMKVGVHPDGRAIYVLICVAGSALFAELWGSGEAER